MVPHKKITKNDSVRHFAHRGYLAPSQREINSGLTNNVLQKLNDVRWFDIEKKSIDPVFKQTVCKNSDIILQSKVGVGIWYDNTRWPNGLLAF